MKSFVSVSALLTVLGVASSSFALNVSTTNQASSLAGAMMGPGGSITIVSATYSGAAQAAGTYTDGPLGISDGAVLTSGERGAVPAAERQRQLGRRQRAPRRRPLRRADPGLYELRRQQAHHRLRPRPGLRRHLAPVDLRLGGVQGVRGHAL